VGDGVGDGVGVGVGDGVGVQVSEQVIETLKWSTISRFIVLLVSVHSPVFDPRIVQLTK
jgi:hypothetical protein